MTMAGLHWRGWLGTLLLGCLPLHAQTPATNSEPPHLDPWAPALTPLPPPRDNLIPPPWRVVGLPMGKNKPVTEFDVTPVDGERALRVQTRASYGNLVHPWVGIAPHWLNWQWRLDEPLQDADIHQKNGDDSALKVCVMFDHALERVPLWERTVLQIARKASSEDLPAATVCYLWDSRYPAGSSGANAFTRRMRYVVLRGPTTPLKKWVPESRDVAQDFLRLFGDEATEAPQVLAVLVGADADNTQGHSLGYVRDLRWQP